MHWSEQARGHWMLELRGRVPSLKQLAALALAGGLALACGSKDNAREADVREREQALAARERELRHAELAERERQVALREAKVDESVRAEVTPSAEQGSNGARRFVAPARASTETLPRSVTGAPGEPAPIGTGGESASTRSAAPTASAGGRIGLADLSSIAQERDVVITVNVHVTDKRADGMRWDVAGGAPDPIVQLSVPRTGKSVTRSFTDTYKAEAVFTGIRLRVDDVINLRLVDNDAGEDDLIGYVSRRCPPSGHIALGVHAGAATLNLRCE